MTLGKVAAVVSATLRAAKSTVNGPGLPLPLQLTVYTPLAAAVPAPLGMPFAAEDVSSDTIAPLEWNCLPIARKSYRPLRGSLMLTAGPFSRSMRGPVGHWYG